MKYSKFKLAYKFNCNNDSVIDNSCKDLYSIQKLFDDSYNTFFLADSYKLALWYTKKLKEFISLVESNDLSEKDKYKSAFLVFSQLNEKYNSLTGRENYLIAV